MRPKSTLSAPHIPHWNEKLAEKEAQLTDGGGELPSGAGLVHPWDSEHFSPSSRSKLSDLQRASAKMEVQHGPRWILALIFLPSLISPVSLDGVMCFLQYFLSSPKKRKATCSQTTINHAISSTVWNLCFVFKQFLLHSATKRYKFPVGKALIYLFIFSLLLFCPFQDKLNKSIEDVLDTEIWVHSSQYFICLF